MVSSSSIQLSQLIEAGCHFGHQARRWHPKMAPYIFDTHNGIHIIDVRKTLPLLQNALNVVRTTVAKGGRILFVGTKRQACSSVRTHAQRCGQHYVDRRWLSGLLTNWSTVSKSIDRMKDLRKKIESDDFTAYTKKEQLNFTRMYDKLFASLGGIENMGGVPNLVFVLDACKEHIAISEARRLGIKVISIVDSNVNPMQIDLPIPGNDDGKRAIEFYCKVVADAVLDGLQVEVDSEGAKSSQRIDSEHDALGQALIQAAAHDDNNAGAN